MYVFTVLIFSWVLWTVQFTPRYWNVLFCSLISYGGKSAFVHSAAAVANLYNVAFFVPPGTHHCLVGGGSVEIGEIGSTLLHMTSSGNQTPHFFLSCVQPLYPLDHMFYCLTLKVLNFWKFPSYCSLKPLWSGMGEVVPACTAPTLHPPSPPTVHQLSRLAL